MDIRSATELTDAVGEEIGVGPWVQITQDMVNAFAELSGDRQWIHVDVARARNSPWKGTIAHGNLVLSIGPHLRGYSLNVPMRYGLNYGLDRLRFPAPLPVGSRVRMRTTVARADIADDQLQFVLRNTVELEGGEKPVMVSEPITRYYIDTAAGG
jgi:acyl dehydratase